MMFVYRAPEGAKALGMVDKPNSSQTSGWRKRLVDAMAKAVESGEVSYRELSRRAQRSQNYAQQFATSDKDLGVESLIALCDAMDISVAQILLNVRWDREVQEAIATFAALKAHDPAAFENFRQLMATYRQRVIDEADTNMDAVDQRLRKPHGA